jgi:hypothetical protein
MAYSDDSGVTWAVGSSSCLTDPISDTSDSVLRLRAFCLGGQVGLLVWSQDGSADLIDQYVSADGGCTFSLVEAFSAEDKACPDVAVRDGIAYVATVENDAGASGGLSDLVPYVRRISSASQGLSGVEAVCAANTADDMEWGVQSGGAGTEFDEAECAILLDDDGIAWLYGLDFETGSGKRELVPMRSDDGGDTWSSPWISSASAVGMTIFDSDDAATYLLDIAVAPERGRAVLFHRMVADASHDDSLCAMYLGGWSTVGRPEDESYFLGRGVSGLDQLWLPLDKPDDMGATWAVTDAGAPTSTLGATGLTISCGAAESRVYTTAPAISTNPANGLVVLLQVKVTSGTGTADIRISDGTDAFAVRVSVTTTSIVLRDQYAGANLETVTTAEGATGAQILLHLCNPSGTWNANNGKLRAWYRGTGDYSGIVPEGPRADREWTHIGLYTGLTFNATTTTSLQWGSATGSSSNTTWRMVGWSGGQYNTGNLIDASTGAIRGRTLSTSSSPIHIAEGLRVHGSDGPTVNGDTFTIDNEFDHPIAAIDPSLYPSPRKTWRSTGVGQQDIIWTGVDLGIKTGDLIAVYLAGANFRTATLYRDSSGTNKVMDIDLASGLTSLAFTRTRDCLYPTGGAGGSAPFYFHERALVGAHFDLTGGDIRKVRTNLAGAWLATPPPTSYASARVYLEEYDAGDSAGATGALWMPQGLFLTTAIQSTNTLMLRIPSQTTAEGYMELGTCLIGRVRVLASEWGRDWSISWTPASSMTETRSGARRARRLGPTRAAWEVGWTDGMSTNLLYTSGGAPDHLTLGYTGADALAAYSDTPRTLGGLIEATDGPVLPVVLCSAVAQQGSAITAAAPVTILDPTLLMYGRFMTETLRLDNLLGEPGKEPGPILKAASCRFEREV